MPYQYFSDGEFPRKSLFRFCPSCGGELTSPRETTRQTCEACGYVHYVNPVPGVVCIIENSCGKVLIGLRAQSSDGANKWCLPGGYIDGTESFLAAAVREVREETGLDMKPESVVNVVSNNLEGSHNTIVVVLLGKARSGELRAMDDIVDLRWIDKREHQAVEYAFEADKRIVDDYFEGTLGHVGIDNRFFQ